MAAVADGAGSARLAEVGASVASSAVCSQVRKRLRDTGSFGSDEIVACIERARDTVFDQAEADGTPPRELACTLLVAVVGPTNAVFAQIGDGAIVVSASGAAERALPAEPTEYANVTHFLTGEDWREHLRVVETTPPPWFAMLTDGLEPLCIDPRTDTPVAGFFEAFVEAIRGASPDVSKLVVPLRQFLGSERVTARTDDDTTLLVAVLQGEP